MRLVYFFTLIVTNIYF